MMMRRKRERERERETNFFLFLIMFYDYGYVCQRAAAVKGHIHIALYKSSEQVDGTYIPRQSLQAKKRKKKKKTTT